MKAIVIGAGIGGLALGIRLQSLGVQTTIVEKQPYAGGRAGVLRADGFTFDMGPTVLTVPHLIEELFALERGSPWLERPDFPKSLGAARRITEGVSGGPASSRYVKIVPVLPFYRIHFGDGTFFDFDGDAARTRAWIARTSPRDLPGYERFLAAARIIFERAFLELGHTHFGSAGSMLRVLPDLGRVRATQSLYGFVSQYMRDEKLRAAFSFESLLVGGNPLRVPATYAMIHFAEKTWGVHFAMGGTGALVRGFVRKFTELGGTLHHSSEVVRIDVAAGRKPRARGVVLADGRRLQADAIVSNGDYAATYGLIDGAHRRRHSDARVKRTEPSISLLVVYFGFRAEPGDAEHLRHHNMIFDGNYVEQLRAVFDRKVLSDEPLQYFHVPTLTDPSLAPPGHHAAYTLVAVPHNGSGIDWGRTGDPYAERILTLLDERGYIPRLRERLVFRSFLTPDYFERTLNSRLGNAFGLEPRLLQSAFFRPHNRSEDVANLYLVGANTQPGGGTPAVMMSAKMTARLIAEDFALPRAPSPDEETFAAEEPRIPA